MRREKQESTARSRTNATDISDDVLEFVRAIDDFKRENNKPFPTWTEILPIVRDLGYTKS